MNNTEQTKELQKLFFDASKEVMIVPDKKDTYLLIDRNHYLKCKNKDPVNCNMFSMDRITLKKGDNNFEDGELKNIRIGVNDENLTLEWVSFSLRDRVRKRTATYKENLKLNRYYNSDCYGAKITPFWYEKLTKLEVIKQHGKNKTNQDWNAIAREKRFKFWEVKDKQKIRPS